MSHINLTSEMFVWKAPYLDVFTANATLRPTLLENWLENQVVQCSRS